MMYASSLVYKSPKVLCKSCFHKNVLLFSSFTPCLPLFPDMGWGLAGGAWPPVAQHITYNLRHKVVKVIAQIYSSS